MTNRVKSAPAVDVNKATAAATASNRRRKPSKVTEPSTEFGKTFQSILGKKDPSAKVNEEELFAGTVFQLVKNKYGADFAQDFKSAFRLNLIDKPNTEKFASAERAAEETLKFFVSSTLMTKEDASDIRKTAFELAQMDDNKDALWDSYGDTKSMVSADRGTRLIQQRLEESGNAPVASAGAKRSSGGAASASSGNKMLQYSNNQNDLKTKVADMIRRLG